MKTYQISIPTFTKATRFQNHVSKARGKVDLKQDHYTVNAKSILGIFSLDLNRSMELCIHEEEDEALLMPLVLEYLN